MILRKVLRDRHAFLIREEQAVAIFEIFHVLARTDPCPALNLRLLVLIKSTWAQGSAKRVLVNRQPFDHGLRHAFNRAEARA